MKSFIYVAINPTIPLALKSQNTHLTILKQKFFTKCNDIIHGIAITFLSSLHLIYLYVCYLPRHTDNHMYVYDWLQI